MNAATHESPLRFDPRSPAFRANPYATYHDLRTHHPIYYRPERRDWVLTRYSDIVNVLKNPKFGRSDQGVEALDTAGQAPLHPFLVLRHQSQKLMAQWLVLRNPPVHTRIRQVMRTAFTPARIQALHTHLQTTVDALIRRVQDGDKMDVIDDFAFPLTLDVNCKILGLPTQAWHPDFKQWSQDLSTWADLDVTPIANERGLLVMAGLAAYFKDWIATCRANSKWQDNLIGMLIQAEAAGRLSEEELLSTCTFMFTVGHASTANLIGTSIMTLLKHPEQMRLLQANPSFISMAIAESLRYESPVQGIARTARCHLKIADQTIHQGDIVHCIIGAANRDPEVFSDPDTFDIRRQPNPYLSFGKGIHTCIGKQLAIRMAEVAVGQLVSRLPQLTLDTICLEWEDAFLGRGLKSLPVVF